MKIQRDFYGGWAIRTDGFDYPLDPRFWLALTALWITWLYRWRREQ